MQKVPEVTDYCQRCLSTERWDGNVVVMVVDASFTSIGLNYFQTVVPNVELFRQKFVHNRKIITFKDLVKAKETELEGVWKNKRSWHIAKSIASYLARLKTQMKINDRQVFIHWARNTKLEWWDKDPIGEIKGVGINTFQYLRMMGGVDTVMPDKIVKRVINEILAEAGMEIPSTDTDFVHCVHQMGIQYGYRPIELCWMTWLIQSESNLNRMQKYSHILSKI
ncbi:MAG: hypothetical protein V1904_13835 [Bacteroidota bacterium]